MKEIIQNKKISITGASGFLGRALIKELLKFKPKKIKAFGHSEKRLTDAQKQFPECEWIAGDINDYKVLEGATKGIDIVFHLAAIKHIPVAEKQPILTGETNIHGVINLIYFCVNNDVSKVVGISTDKAYKPINMYGMTKNMMERFFVEANRFGVTDFMTCRYGNVMASAGSVFEVWDKLGQQGKSLKITDPDMTRFYFKVEDAVQVIFETLKKNDLKKPYIPKMKAMIMGDVADIFSEHYKVKVISIGNRGGEKIHESLSDDLCSKDVGKYSKEEIKGVLKSLNLLK